MTPESQKLCLEALKAVGKALGQMGLYKIGHPAVTACLEECHGLLSRAFGGADGASELAFALDRDKLLVNGQMAGTAGQLPGSLIGFFNRFKLHSITLASGVTLPELTALCELASLRPEAAKGVVPQDFLKERQVSGIRLNEAIYAKVEKAADGASVQETAAPSAPPPESIDPQAIKELTLEAAIRTLVHASVQDPQRRELILKAVMDQIQEDIRKRIREATAELQKEKGRLENEQTRTMSVLGQMSEGAVVVDDFGKVLMMNPAAEELYGLTLGEIAGKSLAEAVKEEHLLTLAKEISTPTDRPVNKEVDQKGEAETSRALRAATAVVQNEAGKVVGMVSSLSDAAKFKETQRMQREFVAHVTHELRAPLSAIRAALDILGDLFKGKLKEEEDQVLSTASRNADRLANLINDILDFSKMESGRLTVYPAQAKGEALVKEAAESLQPWASKKGIQILASAQTGLPDVLADPKRAVQVMVNLLSNAIKFSPQGGKIWVKAEREASGKFQLFSVKDAGPGIEKKDQEKIFEKFVQVAAGERHVGGTGLGLAIAKALTHLMNGRMWVESEAGRGATFFFTLPIYVPPREEPSAPPPKPKPWWRFW